MSINFKRLSAEHSAAYRAIRLESLKLYPDSYGAGFPTESEKPQLQFEQAIENDESAEFVIGTFDDQQLVGICAIASRDKGQVDLMQLYITPHHQGKRLSIALLNEARKAAQSQFPNHGYFIGILGANEKLIDLYRTAGFELTGDVITGTNALGQYIEETRMEFQGS